MNVDPEWSLEEAFVELSERHPPGSLFHGRTRNLLLQVWGELVGRSRALAELEALVRKSGSRTAFSRNYRISPRSRKELENYFDALPPEVALAGRWRSGSQLGPWTLLRRLGRGGNSEVWRASSAEHGEVALKLPGAGTAKRRRFAAEVQILTKLKGVKGVMPVVASGETDGTPWLAMPVAADIRSEIAKRKGPIFVLRGMQSIANTLAELHTRRISHRDIKPDNIYWLEGRWVLADFGIASFPGKEAMTQNGRKLGPVYFIAPEMLNSPATSDGARADVYSLVKTLWVLMSGQSFPPPGEHRLIVKGLRVSSYIRVAGYQSLDRLIDKCTRHDPEERKTAKAISRLLGTTIKKGSAKRKKR